MNFIQNLRKKYNLIWKEKSPGGVTRPTYMFPNRPIAMLNRNGVVLAGPKSLKELADIATTLGADVNIDWERKKFTSNIILSGSYMEKKYNPRMEEPGIIIDMDGWKFEGINFHDIPGGVRVKSINNDIIGCDFTKIRSRALSTDALYGNINKILNLYITENSFWNVRGNRGTSIHLPNGDGCRVVNNYFTGGEVGIDIGNTAFNVPWLCSVIRNRFYAVEVAIRAKGMAGVLHSRNEFTRCIVDMNFSKTY